MGIQLFKRNQETLKAKTRSIDSDIFERFRQHRNPEDFELLYQRYRTKVFLICYKIVKDKDTARDITSDIFKELFEKGAVREVNNFEFWLISVSKKKCYSFFEKEKVRNKHLNNISTHEKRHPLVQSVEEIQDFDKKEIAQKILNDFAVSLEELNEEQRNCLQLHFLKRMKYAEIADIYNIPIKRVDNNIMLGKKKLEKILSAKGWNKDLIKIYLYEE